MSEQGGLSKSGSKPLVIKVQLKPNNNSANVPVKQEARNDDLDGELAMDDFCLENDSAEEEEFSQKRKKRASSKSESDLSKGINTRKKKAARTDFGKQKLESSASFSSSGFGTGFGGIESSILGDQTSTKRGSRGSFAQAKEDEPSDEDDHASVHKSVFWKGIKEYIIPFSKADLDFCNVEKIPNLDQKLFQIPNLGTHYKEVWHQEDQTDLQEHHQGQESYSGSAMQTRQVSKSSLRITDDPAGTDDMISEKKDANKPVRCGDITSRILSALIEDQLVPAHLLSSSYSSGTSLNSTRSTNEGNIAMNNNPNSNSNNNNNSSNQQHTMQEIDDRLKKEVLSLGLIDQGAVNKIHLQKEDDEICRELKRIQAELVEKAQINKQRRAKYYPLILAKMEEQKQERKLREEMRKTEETLTRNLRNLKKRKRAPSSSSVYK